MKREERARPSWDEYFMEIAKLAASRSTCLRRQVGAVIVKNKRLISTGYNGAPSGMKHCLELGCLRDELGIESGTHHEICRGLHAEQNALLFAKGIDLTNASLYCTNQPCVVCTKLIIQAGITEVIYKDPYPDKLALQMFSEANIKLYVMEHKKRKLMEINNSVQ